MISLGKFEKEELETACLAANVVCPQENLGEGLTVQVIDGIRTWSSSTSRGDVVTQGVPATFEGKYTLSPRFVHEADCLASEGNPVEIRIENGHAFASNDFGLFSMILGNKESNVSPIDGDNLTTIEISQKGLHHILHFGSCDPAAFIPESELAKVPNVSKLSVLEESIGIHSFFDEIGCNRTGSFQKASVCGPIGEFVVDRMMCHRVSKFLNSAEKLDIKISLDINKGNVVQFAGANWKILLHRVNTGAARYYNELVDVLRQSDLFFLEGIDSSICVQHAGQSVLLNLLDNRWPVVRCTIELTSGIKRTFDLLSEIDQQNESQVDAKYFSFEDSVYACIDVRCDDLGHLNERLCALIEDSYLLGDYLASLGTVGDEL